MTSFDTSLVTQLNTPTLYIELHGAVADGIGGNEGGSKLLESCIDTPVYSPPELAPKPVPPKPPA